MGPCTARFQLPNTASFSTKRVNKTTFVVTEDDALDQYPLIYVKIHPKAPVIILSDTGCDEPSERKKSARWIHLRDYLERCPVFVNGRQPLNPNGQRKYVIIFTHCHFDHIGGIEQFLKGGTTDIVASAAGRDFVESDLAGHSLFDYRGVPVPQYQVTLWAQPFERLIYPLRSPNDTEARTSSGDTTDLGITIIQTPGHTPDELAWYDHDEMHLYVGDSFYEEGKHGVPVVWTKHGNMIEWYFSMQKLLYFVRSENERARAVAEAAEASEEDGWTEVARQVKVGCGHETSSVDGEEILLDLEKLWWAIEEGKVPIVRSEMFMGEFSHTWREKGEGVRMSFLAPARLMDEARKFFKGS
ncbi:hypothetical protein K431DRAFT_248299 [Polychaeton citri CBS 116435]|uniref:Metallo-beta-lactamase domain-containing protein n=1 Tax=Polychaeton citri CBS 116435 TaxID=1314669 RepID=A0A9P4UPX7_9PEZI|nr:hypothetical protein K431DRAFT_248299 [Polychaeton citri CBS 116435]